MTPDTSMGVQAAILIADQPVPVAQPFEAQVWICDEATPRGLSVTALMPAHQHGMNYRPTITAETDGTFTAAGMVFHMPGLWRVDVTADTDHGIARFSTELMAR